MLSPLTTTRGGRRKKQSTTRIHTHFNEMHTKYLTPTPTSLLVASSHPFISLIDGNATSLQIGPERLLALLDSFMITFKHLPGSMVKKVQRSQLCIPFNVKGEHKKQRTSVLIAGWVPLRPPQRTWLSSSLPTRRLSNPKTSEWAERNYSAAPEPPAQGWAARWLGRPCCKHRLSAHLQGKPSGAS